MHDPSPSVSPSEEPSFRSMTRVPHAVSAVAALFFLCLLLAGYGLWGLVMVVPVDIWAMARILGFRCPKCGARLSYSQTTWLSTHIFLRRIQFIGPPFPTSTPCLKCGNEIS